MHHPSFTRTEIVGAAMRPMLAGRRYWIWVAILSLPVLWGTFAYGYQVSRGLGVTGLSDQFFWGIYETNLVAFIGYSYGGALVSAILRLTGAGWRAPITRIAEGTALVTLLVGAAFALVHLGRPERVWQFFTSPNLTSPLIWDFVAILTYLVATVIFFYLPMIPDLAAAADGLEGRAPRLERLYRFLAAGWKGLSSQHRLLDRALIGMAILIIPVAVTVHSVLAWAFSVHMRDGWHSSIFGPYFVMGALFSGVAMVILITAAARRLFHLEAFIGLVQFRNLGYLVMMMGPFYLYFTFSDLLGESYTLNIGSERLLSLLMVSSYAPLFWGVIFLGILLPTLLIAWPRTRTIAGITVASALVVVSMWVKRFLIVVPTLAVPLVDEHAAVKLYSPTWVEFSITLAAAFAVPALLLLLFRLFPILSIAEIEEESRPAEPVRPYAAGLHPAAESAAGAGEGGESE